VVVPFGCGEVEWGRGEWRVESGSGESKSKSVRERLSEVVVALDLADLGGLGDAHGFGVAEGEAE